MGYWFSGKCFGKWYLEENVSRSEMGYKFYVVVRNILKKHEADISEKLWSI